MDPEVMEIQDLLAAVKEYNGRRSTYLTYEKYWRGQQELKYAAEAFRREYGQQFEGLRENLLPGIVHAFTDELEVASFGSEANDKIESELGLKGLLSMVFDEAFRCGDGYILAWPNSKGTVVPHFIKARDCVPKVDPDDPSQLLWIARFWYLGKRARVNIYYTDRVERWITSVDIANLNDQGNPVVTAEWPTQESSWEPYVPTEPGEGGPILAHNFGGCPAIWLKQDPMDPYEHGVSVLDDAIPLQDMLNRELADTMVLAGTYSRPFWYLLNFKPDSSENPLVSAQNLAQAYAGVYQALNGTPTNANSQAMESQARQFKRSEQSIFAHDGPGPFGQLTPPDLLKLLDFQDRIALKMCRVVGLASYYVTQTSGDVPSGASLRVLRKRMTARIGRFQAIATPVLKGLGELLGMSDPDVTWTQTSEMDPIEAVDVAVSKKRDLGYALEDAIRDLDEEDAGGIVRRAEEKAQEAKDQFLNGGLDMGTDPTDTAMRGSNQAEGGPNQE